VIGYQKKLKNYAKLFENFSTKEIPISQSLGTFTKRLPKAIVKIVTFVRSSVLPHGTAEILRDGFLWNFVFWTY